MKDILAIQRACCDTQACIHPSQEITKRRFSLVGIVVVAPLSSKEKKELCPLLKHRNAIFVATGGFTTITKRSRSVLCI